MYTYVSTCTCIMYVRIYTCTYRKAMGEAIMNVHVYNYVNNTFKLHVFMYIHVHTCIIMYL